MSIEIREADLSDPADAAGFLLVLDAYAQSAVGGGQPLPPEVRARLVPALRDQAGAVVLLALSERTVVGIATCFFGFSTFAARPLLNVHDLAVQPEFQRRGIGRALLLAAEDGGPRRLTSRSGSKVPKCRAQANAFGPRRVRAPSALLQLRA